MSTAAPSAPRTELANPLERSAPEAEPVGARFSGVLRLALGWVFLWAFLDKLLALGFATGRDDETGVVNRFGDAAWINGGSPTEGFMQFGLNTRWFFDDLYADLAGQA